MPYLLMLPAGLWLAVFFAVPVLLMLSLSLQEGNLVDGFRQTFHWQTYTDALGTQTGVFLRSLRYALLATCAALGISYPLACWIAFRAGPRRSAYLFLLLLPFFVSFILRTVSWKFVLADNGILLGAFKERGLLSPGFHVLETSGAVVAGLTYTYLPFMVLPIYVSLVRIDRQVLEAARDLYASRAQALVAVVLPLSLPGVFAGVIMTFVPAASDYVNAAVLGGPGNTMIGNVVRTAYFDNGDYPTASALSFTVMATLLVAITVYARVIGARGVLEGSGR